MTKNGSTSLRITASGDLVLLHGFQQRGLRFGRGAIDFISKDQVRENRPALKLERAPATLSFHDDVGAEDIGWHQVGCELDAAKREFEDFAQGADEERLAETGHAFEQNMTSRKQGNQRIFDDLFLADDDFGNLGAKVGVGVAESFNGLLSFHTSALVLR